MNILLNLVIFTDLSRVFPFLTITISFQIYYYSHISNYIEVLIMKKLILLLVAVFLTGCSGGTYKNITADEAKDLIDEGKVVVIDVRTPEEYNSGHIPEAELVPLQVIDGMSSELIKDKSYLIVCRSGNRSQQASEILAEKGFKDIYNMSGGMNSWTYELEQ
jgi:rhodanese-related sulfurtransferase